MPFDSTGKWIPDNQTVESRVTGLVSQNSPLMQQAAAAGTRTAAARGLANGSLAVGAAQDAVLKAATPIATADASNATALGQTTLNNTSQETIATGQQQTQRDINAAGIASNEKISGNQLQTQRDLQSQQIGSNEKLTGLQLNNQSAIATAGNASTEKIAGMQSQTQRDLSAEQIAAQASQTDKTLASQAAQTDKTLAAQQAQTVLSVQSQQAIASMQLSSADKQKVSTDIAQLESTYASQFAAISNNTAIPAAARSAYLANLSAIRDSNYALVEQIYGVQLQWTSATVAGGYGGTTEGASSKQNAATSARYT